MSEIILWDDYMKSRPTRLRWFGPLLRILQKINRDWVFSVGLRNKIYRFCGVKLSRDDSEIYIGRETWIDDIAPDAVTIEPGAGIGWRCVIFAHNTATVPPNVAPVVIGKKALLGHCVTVMPGVTIGEYAQIGCNALVTKDIPPRTIAAGVPAKPLRQISPEELDQRANWNSTH